MKICIRCGLPGRFGKQVMNGKTYLRSTCYSCRAADQREYRAKNIVKTRPKDAARMRKYRPAYFAQNPEKKQFSKPWSRLHPEKYLFMTMQRRKRDKPGAQYHLKMTFQEFLDEIGGKVPTICPVFGIRMFIDDKSHSDHLPTVDRLDGSKAYEKGNVAVISWRDFGTADEHRKIADWMDRQNGGPSS